MKDGLSKEFLAEQYAEAMKMFMRDEFRYIESCPLPFVKAKLRESVVELAEHRADEFIRVLKRRYDENFE